jgi:hypothetical protein
MAENITNVTTITGTPIDWVNFFQTLPASILFGGFDTIILLIALFGFREVADKWKFTFPFAIMGGLAYNFLYQTIPRQGIEVHGLLLGFIIMVAIMIYAVKREM